MKKTKKQNHRSSDEKAAEGSSSSTDCDQDSDVSFMNDTDEEIDTDENCRGRLGCIHEKKHRDRH